MRRIIADLKTTTRTPSVPSAILLWSETGIDVGACVSLLTTGVSCPKFDLCRTCYQKVEEIHPAHIFLSLPDKSIPQLVESPPTNGRPVQNLPARHPGAFCHKCVMRFPSNLSCLQDIVGPRFHCAVCPSWDLCIQCEGLSATGNGSHTADHIMMKVSGVQFVAYPDSNPSGYQ